MFDFYIIKIKITPIYKSGIQRPIKKTGQNRPVCRQAGKPIEFKS